MNEYFIINESTKIEKPKKKYKCPYCELRATKLDLTYHVDEEHEDLIPQGYSAARIVFNHVNKKEHGTCIQCGKESPWNEKTWKYDRLCGNKKCHENYIKSFRTRMVDKHGKEHLLNDPEKQKEMLANRRISGEYKFKDGGIRSYCGSYERKLLEFYDTVLNVHSKDIMTPGPTIEYEFEGKKSFWITDIYYVPANLVHDVKDGGNNPNKRQMDVYRSKQDAKEEAIAKMNKFNYIRLTDNNFQQLLLILAELKEQLLDKKTDSFIIRINESSATAGAMSAEKDAYIVPYLMNNSFIGTAFSTTRDMKELYVIQNGKKVKTNPLFLKDYEYSVLKFKGDYNIEDLLENEEQYNTFYFYEALANKRCLDIRQILLDENFEEVVDIYTEAILLQEIKENSLLNAVNRKNLLPLVSLEDTNKRDKLLYEYSNLNILQNDEGYIVYNTLTNESSSIYEDIDNIPRNILNLLDR